MNVQTLTTDLAEFEQCLLTARSDRLRRLLEVNISKIKSELADLSAAPSRDAPSSDATSLKPRSSPSGAGSLSLPPGIAFSEVKGYSWTETDKALKLYINTEGCGLLSCSDIVFQCSKKALLFYTTGNARKSVSLTLQPLKGELDASCTGPVVSAARFKENEVILQIPKAKSGKWYDLISKDESSSAGGKLGSDDSDSNPGDALMKMMKKMYDEGDDKLRETIGKAMLESRQKQQAGLDT